METLNPRTLVFIFEQDYDLGWVVMITPKAYWEQNHCIKSTHFRIQGLEWGCGDKEATWCLNSGAERTGIWCKNGSVPSKVRRNRVRRKLRKLGMQEVFWY